MKSLIKLNFQKKMQQLMLPGQRLLVALSGGPDSMALLHLLREVEGYSLAIVHVDHGWRKESKKEAIHLCQEAEKWGVAFYSTALCLNEEEGNLEDISRRKRYQFFKNVYDEIGADALILGHHQDDLVETTLKRWLEGAHIQNCCGMAEDSARFGMRLLRPLLQFKKKELADYLTTAGVKFFTDPTNEHEHFLRARMRKSILPGLERSFQKGISENIRRFSDRSKHYKEFLDDRIAKMAHSEEAGVMGNLYTFPMDAQFHHVEYEHFILRKTQEVLSSEEIDSLVHALVVKKNAFVLEKQKSTWVVEKNQLFLLNGPLSSVQWDIVVSNIKGSSGWRNLWVAGASTIQAPEGATFSVPSLRSKFLSEKTLSEYYRKAGVPVFLRSRFPVCFLQNEPIADFLSNRTDFQGAKGGVFTLRVQFSNAKRKKTLKDKLMAFC